MPPFEKGRKKTGGRVKGQPTRAQQARVDAVAFNVWCRSLFEDPRYRASLQQRLWKGRLAPQVESKLLAYAYGEPARDVNVNATVRGVVSVIHEHVAALQRPVVDVPALPEPEGPALPVAETVIEPARISGKSL